MIVMKKTLIIAVTCCFLSVLAGCFLGDRGVAKIVSLNLPPSAGKAKVSISANDSQVQEALQVIDRVLGSNGLSRIEVPQPSSDGTLFRYEDPTKRGCSVSLANQQLTIVFFEFGQRKPSDRVKKISSELQKELSNRYGAPNVRVTTRT